MRTQFTMDASKRFDVRCVSRRSPSRGTMHLHGICALFILRLNFLGSIADVEHTMTKYDIMAYSF